jgi:hypothetical protein
MPKAIIRVGKHDADLMQKSGSLSAYCMHVRMRSMI